MFLKRRQSHLAAPLRHGRRARAGRRIEADLDVAREVILDGGRRGKTTDAEGGDRAHLGDDQLDLAERAATRDVRLANILQQTRARRGDRGRVLRAEARPGRGREGTRGRILGDDAAHQRGNGDVVLVVGRNLAEGGGHFIFRA